MSQYREGSQPIPGYTLVEFLGRGSYGEVWKATGPGGTEVAVKFIALDSQQGLKEFKAIGLVKRLRHPNLVPIHAFWLCDSLGNVISDAPVGESLETESSRFRIGGRKELVIAMGLGDQSLAQKAEHARASGGIAPGQLLRYMDGAARGIDFLNEPAHPPGNSPIIHCDIKPANLLIVGGEVQVCDYGVAQALGTDVKKTLGAGTPAYSPPELINNDPSPQTDQYSLAITYYELRTGRLPFDEKHALRANITGELDLSLLERDERAVVRRATSLQPERRYPSVQDFADELRVACGVSLSRSAVIPRARERRPPPQTPFSPPPVPPAVRPPQPAAATPAAPFDTVSFPESLRPTVPAPKPAPRADDSPWAEGTAMITALPSTPAAPVRRQWVWPLVIGLVLGIGGIVAFVVTRPPSVAVVVTPPDDVKNEGTKPPVGVAPTAADLLKKLGDLTFGTAADVENAAKRINEALKTPALPAPEVDKLRAALPELIRPRLKSGEGAFAWLDTLAVPDLPLGKEKDLAAAKRWYAAAAAFAKSLPTPDHDRLAAVLKFVEYLEAVNAEPEPADELARYERAITLAERHQLPPQRRYPFLFQPLVGEPIRGVTDDRKPAAARFLVRVATDLVAAPFWDAGKPPTTETRKQGAVKLLTRAYEFAPRETVAAVTDPARRDKLPCDELAEDVAKKGEAPAAEAVAAYAKDQHAAKKHAAAAIALYEDAIKIGRGHPLLASWHHQLGGLVAAYFAERGETPEQVRYAATAIGHSQTAYLLVAERLASGKDDAVILKHSERMKDKTQYKGLSAAFASQVDGNRDYWPALSAECTFMQSEMTVDDRDALKLARDVIPMNASDADLRACRDRMERLLKLSKTRSELLK